jgi:hypothetical protein
MHQTEVEIVDVAKRLVALSMHAAQAFNIEQSKLQLDLVLSQERLSSTKGTDESLKVLGRLKELTSAHKVAFEKVVLASSAAMSKPLSELPEDLRNECRERLVATVTWHLSAQSDFYANRERWLAAAKDICNLIEARRATCQFGEQGVVFADDQDFDAFEALLGVIEEIHQLEVAGLKERLSRIASSASVLGFRPAE